MSEVTINLEEEGVTEREGRKRGSRETNGKLNASIQRGAKAGFVSAH